MIRKRPELDTENPPGQIVYKPTHFEKPVVKEIEEYQNRKVCASPCMEGKRFQDEMGRWVWTGCSCYPKTGG